MNITEISGGLCAPKGFKAAGIHCGIRKNPGKKDLALIYSAVPATAAAVYTQNKVKAAPVSVTHKHMQSGIASAIICNSGNANACNATALTTAKEMCSLTAAALGIPAEDVLVASTGVIGVELDINPIKNGMSALVTALNDNGSDDAANAIMTTDTKKKEIAVELILGGKKVRIGGICKGSGMIHPNMATMLGFVTTDINIDRALLQKTLASIASDTFNMVSVDGDTSTNDILAILANGLSENEKLTDDSSPDYKLFYAGLLFVCKHLAVSIAADGEGATKLLECTVSNAENVSTAKILAKSVITSSLFKAAMYGADANWGRVLCALGNAEAPFNPEEAEIAFRSTGGEILVCKDGHGVSFSEEQAKEVLSKDKIIIHIKLKSDESTATAWGCDLTYDYVKINGDYRS